MRLSLIFLCFFTLVGYCVANTENHGGEHSGHESHRVGMHGMVLFSDGLHLYASHLPLYSTPHDYQILYQVESRYQSELISLLTTARREVDQGNALLTLLPESFDLNRLIAGDAFEIKATFYKGHFERGGSKWKEDESFQFVKLIYKRQLPASKKMTASASQTVHNPNRHATQWVSLPTENGKKSMYVYRIERRPSFDAIVLAEGCPSAEHLPSVAPRTPSIEQVYAAFDTCSHRSVMYFETADFAL